MASSVLIPAPDPPVTPIPYTIAGSSDHSGRYVAQNIIMDTPLDQMSRWSGAVNNTHSSSGVVARQWILLKLKQSCVLKSITFGKYHKPHPCTMKEFKLYVGTSEDHLTEIMHCSLKNDAAPETFAVRYVNGAGLYFPTQYVKIVPLSAHGQSFHTSLWHVAISGITDEDFLDVVRSNYDKAREVSVLRHVLKHLRQRRLLTPFNSILSRTPLRLEHPLVAQLHRNVVLEGSWSDAESTLQQLSAGGLFDEYRRACQPYASWTRLHGTDADGDAPSPRGGHAMCIDASASGATIYLLGGWDGSSSLDDFWAYDIPSGKWRCLEMATGRQKNGPGPRSCHKMVFDRKSGCIYVLGRLTDEDAVREPPHSEPSNSAGHESAAHTIGASPQARQGGETSNGRPITTAFCSEFYRYHTRGLDAGKWDLLTFDTASLGGPPLVFDHQMVMDSDTQMIYVFGGRVVDGDWSSSKYSGLYSYNVRTSKWRMLQPSENSASSGQAHIPPRFGHSMILAPSTQTLFIFAGQRDDKYLADMWAFDLKTNTALELYANFSSGTVGGPDACFTQRAVVDVNLSEIYVLCGLTRNPKHEAPVLRADASTWLYRYHSTRRGKWSQILPELRDNAHDESTIAEPAPRYAHQVVYDPHTLTVFMHGGNAGLGDYNIQEDPDRNEDEMHTNDDAGDIDGPRRLDDFWCMKLKRPEAGDVIRRATYRLRRQQFREMCEELPPIKALNFLQTEVSAVVDHDDTEETTVFRSLLSHLLAPASHPLAEPEPMHSQPQNESWTNKLDEELLVDRGEALDEEVDISKVMDCRDAAELDASPSSPLSGARYKQRTAVFEALLEYINEDAKEPTDSLLDMIDGDSGF